PLHPDIVVVAQPGRTLVPGTDRQSVAARRLPLRARPRRLYPGIHRRPQQRPQTLRVDRHRRVHPRQSRTRSDRPRKSQLNTGHTTRSTVDPCGVGSRAFLGRCGVAVTAQPNGPIIAGTAVVLTDEWLEAALQAVLIAARARSR